MFKKIISLLIVISITLSISGVVLATNTQTAPPSIPTTGDVWDGTITEPKNLVIKEGLCYYEITKCSELAYVAQTGGDWLTYNYILGNDLIMNNTILSWDEQGNLLTPTDNLNSWTPIGGFDSKSYTQSSKFTGIFDGADHKISGIYVDAPTYYHVGLFGVAYETNIKNLEMLNSYICGYEDVGGIVGIGTRNNTSNVSFSGLVKGSLNVGGIHGSNGYISNCENKGTIVASIEYSGGIVGSLGHAQSVSKCSNKGNVIGLSTGTGGIAGWNYYLITDCENSGKVSGVQNVGGIVGESASSTIKQCTNSGTIYGETNVGGITGSSDSATIINVYDIGCVGGTSSIGGIAGILKISNLKNAYSLSNNSAKSLAGALVGNSDHYWGNRSTIENCFYAKDSSSLNIIYAFGNRVDDGSVADDCVNIAEAKTILELKQQDTFVDWDFINTWVIDPTSNSGYPYFSFQGTHTSVNVNNILLSEKELTIIAEKSKYLTANISPTNATNKEIIWTSNNESVAKVSETGKVTGVSAGTATITATSADGGYSDSCVVTVTTTSYQEYKINSITIKDNTGKELSEIPNDSFLATVSITTIASGADTMVVIAKYSDKGTFEGLMYVSAEDMPIGSTIKLTLPIDNKNGDIAKLKAFSWASFNSLTPMGNSVCFPAE